MEEYAYTPKPRTLRQFRRFDYTDVESEEQYLTEMHRQGWKFQKLGGLSVYTFEECTPDDTPRRTEDRENHLRLYEDYGWECVLTHENYRYFRKTAASPAEREIFSDDASRLDMMRKIFRRELLFTVYATVMTTLCIGFMYVNLEPSQPFTPLALTACITLELILYAFLLRRGIGFLKFHKKYSRKKPG